MVDPLAIAEAPAADPSAIGALSALEKTSGRQRSTNERNAQQNNPERCRQPDVELGSLEEKQHFFKMIATMALSGAASSTIERHWDALKATHTAAGKMNSWMSEEGSYRALKSLASLGDSRRHRSERGAISSEEFEDLAQCAIKSGRPHLAVGYYLLMFGLLRHNHIGRALVGDVTFTIDKRTIRVTSWGYETEAERHKEQVHHFPCPADIICSYIKDKQLERHDLLLPEWNEVEAAAVHQGLGAAAEEARQPPVRRAHAAALRGSLLPRTARAHRLHRTTGSVE